MKTMIKSIHNDDYQSVETSQYSLSWTTGGGDLEYIHYDA